MLIIQTVDLLTSKYKIKLTKIEQYILQPNKFPNRLTLYYILQFLSLFNLNAYRLLTTASTNVDSLTACDGNLGCCYGIKSVVFQSI